MMLHPFRHTRRRDAFTLVEVLIVVVIIGILAAIVVPYYASASSDSKISALATTTRIMQEKVKEQFNRNGTYPSTIDPAWFGLSQLPAHPQNKYGIATLEVVSTAGLQHPANKVLDTTVAGAFWYNAAEGLLRARVAAGATSASTTQTYNLVNASTETSLGNFSSGSGGGSGGGGS